MKRFISIRGARQNNLRGWDLDLPVGSWTTVTGVSGSGKSSLAMEILYAEGQRRYVETFSPYARQFLERLDAPNVHEILGIPPALAIEGSQPVRTSRSTVGTLIEMTDFLKLLFHRCAVPYCPECGEKIRKVSPEALWKEAVSWCQPGPWIVTFPMECTGRNAETLREGLLSLGFFRILHHGKVVRVEEWIPSASSETVEVVVDRLVPPSIDGRRFVEALESAFRYGQGLAAIHFPNGTRQVWTNQLRCVHCGIEIQDPSPALFSFNSPVGACPRCGGFGRIMDYDPELIVPDPTKSIEGGAVRPFSVPAARGEFLQLIRFCLRRGIPIDRPWMELASTHRQEILNGSDGYPGVRGFLRWLQEKSYKMHVRVFLSRFRTYLPCPDCGGGRLRLEALRWRVEGKTLPQILAMTVEEGIPFFRTLLEAQGDDAVVRLLVEEISQRLNYLREVGLGYLTLDRPSRTLSGGEVERVLLTRALGTRLANTLFVLDEPSNGLHPRDTRRLIRVIRRLLRYGNTVVVVEHDPDLILQSDLVVDLGPGAGKEGGRLVYVGPPQGLLSRTDSVTGTLLASRASQKSLQPSRKRESSGELVLREVRQHNLKGMNVRIPLAKMVCITGVSGSGKSTLLIDILYRGVRRALGHAGERPGLFSGVEGYRRIRNVELVDQTPPARTPRANPATYIGAWTEIRNLFARTEEARQRGWSAGIFSFNTPGGRCESCRGEGFLRVEMQFLSDVLLKCPDCGGRRFTERTLEVRYREKSIADVLAMTVEEALEFFADQTVILQALRPLQRMGLGYLTLGQPLSTLSGGESQRLKMARHLQESVDGPTLFLLDEPTKGLHLADVKTLIEALRDLVDGGHTVVLVEHHLEVIRCADHIIDLGPEGGPKGGWIVAEGPPEEIAGNPRSRTGLFLRRFLEGRLWSPPRRPRKGLHLRQREIPDETGIRIVGARENNLQDLEVQIPRDRLVAITGVSGSGKSTLAFDILFAEGQRRYFESLPAYVRQYLNVLDRPDVDLVAGIPPTVAIEQRTARAGRRSTVATLTEIYHFLRLLFARLGTPYCTRCDIPITTGRLEEMMEALWSRFYGQHVTVLAPWIQGRKGYHQTVFTRARRKGIEYLRVDGVLERVEGPKRLDRFREHWIEAVVARGLCVTHDERERLRSVLQDALMEGRGTAVVVGEGGHEETFSHRRLCPRCGLGFPELDPRHFSFNSPMGACERCDGIGGFLFGDGDAWKTCPACQGSRLREMPRKVRVLGRTIAELTSMTIAEARSFWKETIFPESRRDVSTPIIREIQSRLEALLSLGLGYLTLDRPADTLSGGEAQRIRLAAQLGSNLRGVCYVLDEPTIGLHPRDHQALLKSLRNLRDRGNTVVVVEHDETFIQSADWVIDLGPGPGREGGRVVVQGEWTQCLRHEDSPTVRAITDPSRRRITSRGRKARDGRWIRILGATHHNLKGIDAEIPLGTLTCVTGVSGSGKSSLVEDVLYEGIRNRLGLEGARPGSHRGMEGWQWIRRVRKVDHAPIGRTPRSTPGTYVKVWDEIRRFFADLPEARSRGYGPGRFSFNTPEGRCPLCQGQGLIRQEMSFLPDVYTHCEACEGMRFTRETLSVTYRGRNVGEILAMTVKEAADLFQTVPRILRPLRVLMDLGLGYLTLGQTSPSLSGGEAQRLKLAQELSKGSGGSTLYVLDEPTTGLHLQDVERLIDVLQRLVDRGDTVVVVEHHLDIVAAADYIIDLGPEAGEQGGRIVFQGPPWDVLEAADISQTGHWFRSFLEEGKRKSAGQREAVS